MSEVLNRTREWIDGAYHIIHSTLDGAIRLDLGEAVDQRPDPDGIEIFLPIEVGISSFGGDRINPYTKHFYCGKCRKLMGWGQEWQLYERCPRCGSLIGYWGIGGMKKEVFKEGFRWETLPDIWPVVLNGSNYSSDLEGVRLLSSGTANDQKLNGTGSASTEIACAAPVGTRSARAGQ